MTPLEGSPKEEREESVHEPKLRNTPAYQVVRIGR